VRFWCDWHADSVTISSRRDERFTAYAASHVWFDHPKAPFVVEPREPGLTRGAFAGPDGATVYVVTAHNPGRLLPADENRARHAELVAHVEALAGLTVWPTVGGDQTWSHTEEGVALIGLDDDGARELGARFGQEAIFAWDVRSLRLLECRSERTTPLGWSVEPWEREGPP
jgi:hypothetical protein